MELNKIYCGDSRKLDKIEDNSVHLTVTSPPYYVGKKYEKYLPTLNDYLQMLYDVFAEVVRVTVPGGLICINIGDIAVGSQYNEFKSPEELSILHNITASIRSVSKDPNKCAYLYARYIWDKNDDPWANSSHVSYHDNVQHTTFRALPAWEYVFVYRKSLKARVDTTAADGLFIEKKEWKKLVHGVWYIRSVQRNDYHEAMFPEELVINCLKLYSYPGDTLFDPFMGSGTTAAAAKKFRRNYLGYELDPKYVKMAEGRVSMISEDIIQDTPRCRDKTLNKHEEQKDIFECIEQKRRL